jgi:hypothetical protein
MRNVSLKIVVVFSMVMACVACAQAETKPKPRTTSAFDQLEKGPVMRNLTRFGMVELVSPLIGDDRSPGAMLIRGRNQAGFMRKLTDPAERLAAAEKIIAMMKEAMDLAEKEMEDAEEIAEKAPSQVKFEKKVAAAKVARLYFDIWYFIGDLSGRQAIEGYVNKITNMQDNREDRRIVLKMTQNAIEDMGYMQDDLAEKMREWRDTTAVWMIMAGKGESLLRDANYWSTYTYMNRALALGDSEAHATELEEFKGKDKSKLIADQKKRTLQRRQLLQKVLKQMSPFEKNRRYRVTDAARKLMAVAYRELGEYSKAIDKLAPKRYEGASAAIRLAVAMELPITKIKQGKFSEAPKIISTFKGYAEMLFRGAKDLTVTQQAQVDLRVATLNDYLYRRWAAAATNPTDKSKYQNLRQISLIELFEKYKDESMIKRYLVNYFGNRLLYAQDIKKFSTVQLYIVACGKLLEKEPKRRREMLEMLLGRKDDPATKKLAPLAHWELAVVMNQLKRSIDAADNFIAVSDLLGPDDPKSSIAAKNAAICVSKYVSWHETTRNTNISRSVRLKCVAILNRAVEFDAKNPDLKLSKWYYSLGTHCRDLSQGNCPAREKPVWMKRSAEAFGKVPPVPEDVFLSAQELRLDILYRALVLRTRPGAVDAKVSAEAGRLREQYVQYIKLVEGVIAKLSDKTSARARDLIESVAWADFTRAKLLSEQMGKKIVALVEIKTLLKKWAKVNSVVIAANQWKIQDLINQGLIAEASVELEVFLKANEKNPGVGAGLIEQVVEGIRRAIDKAQGKGGDAGKLASLRKSYLQLAQRLYKPVEGKPIVTGPKVDNERLNLTQLWIGALIQNGRAADALELALKCRKIFDDRRKAQGKGISDKYAPMIRSCEKAVGLPKALDKLAKQYYDEIERLSKLHGVALFDPKEDTKEVRLMQKVMNNAPANAPADRRKRNMKALSRALVSGYRTIIRRSKNLIPLELTVEWNVARCLAVTKDKRLEALEIYTRLIRLTRDELKAPSPGKGIERRYWRLNLEYCQTFYAVLESDKKQMGLLVKYIVTTLKEQGGEDMGGFKNEFYEIESKARRQSK